jgi:hypothetical protein
MHIANDVPLFDQAEEQGRGDVVRQIAHHSQRLAIVQPVDLEVENVGFLNAQCPAARHGMAELCP